MPTGKERMRQSPGWDGFEEVVGAIPDFKVTRTEAGAVSGGSVLRTLAAPAEDWFGSQHPQGGPEP